jgi:hypothetical protein
MSGVNGASIAQTETLTLSRTVELNYGSRSSALSLDVTAGGGRAVLPDSFQKIFDVIDISEEAQEELLRNKQNADALAEYVRRGRGIEIRVLPPRPGKVEIHVSSESLVKSFSLTEQVKLSLQKSVSVETEDGGHFEVEQSIELSLSRTVEFLSSSSQVSLSAGLGAQA